MYMRMFTHAYLHTVQNNEQEFCPSHIDSPNQCLDQTGTVGSSCGFSWQQSEQSVSLCDPRLSSLPLIKYLRKYKYKKIKIFADMIRFQQCFHALFNFNFFYISNEVDYRI